MIRNVLFVVALCLCGVARAAGDPGLDNLNHKLYATPSFTDYIFDRLPLSWDAANRAVHDLAPSADAKRQVIWDYYGFVKNPAMPADAAPLGLIKGQHGEMTISC